MMRRMVRSVMTMSGRVIDPLTGDKMPAALVETARSVAA